MEPEQIHQILPRNVLIRSLHSYRNVLKKGYKMAYNVIVKHLSGVLDNYSGENKKMYRRLTKVLKNMKFIKSLQLKDCRIWGINNEPSNPVYIAKLVHRIKQLSFFDNLAQQKHPFVLIHWLKCLKQLKQLHYEIDQYAMFLLYTDNEVYSEKIRQLYKKMRRNKITQLKISMFVSNVSALKTFLMLSDYPHAIQRLSFNSSGIYFGSKVDTPNITISPSQISRINSLKLKFHEKYRITPSFLNSIMNLSQLTSLSLQFTKSSPFCTSNLSKDIYPILNRIGELKMLKKLKLSLNNWSQEVIDLLEAVQMCPIISFGFNINIDQSEQLLSLIKFLRFKAKLVALKLSITSQFESKDALESLFAQIGELTELRSLKLYILSSARVTLSSSKTLNQSCFSKVFVSLERVFKKLIPLEKFSFESQQIDPKTDFLDLISCVRNHASNLTKLEVSMGEFRPQKTDFELLINFIKELKLIQVLDLSSLSIPLNKFLQELVESILTLKHLSVLSLGEIKGNVGKESFVYAVERILCKNGLRQFDCDISDKFKKSLTNKSKECPKLNIDILMKKNPLLEKVPENLPIFINQDADEEWVDF